MFLCKIIKREHKKDPDQDEDEDEDARKYEYMAKGAKHPLSRNCYPKFKPSTTLSAAVLSTTRRRRKLPAGSTSL